MATLDTDRTHRLGTRAFTLFLGRGVMVAAALGLALAAVYWYGSAYVPKHYVAYYVYGLKLATLFLGAYLVYKVMMAFMKYRAHEYRFDDEFFHITRGYITRHETGVVYHQIQTVTVERTMGARIVGVAHLGIVTSGGTGGASHTASLPAIDIRKARLIQRELLARARAHQQPQGTPRYQPVPFEDLEENEE